MDFQTAYEMKQMQRDLLDKCSIASSCIEFMLERDKQQQIQILEKENLIEQVNKLKSNFPDLYSSFQSMSTPLTSWIPLKKKYLFPTEKQIRNNLLFPGANVFLTVKHMRQKAVVQRCIFKSHDKSNTFSYEVVSSRHFPKPTETETNSYVYVSCYSGPRLYTNVKNTDITAYTTSEREAAMLKMAMGKISMFLRNCLRKLRKRKEYTNILNEDNGDVKPAQCNKKPKNKKKKK